MFIPYVILIIILTSLTTTAQAITTISNPTTIFAKSVETKSSLNHDESIEWLELERKVKIIWEAELDEKNPAWMTIKSHNPLIYGMPTKQILVLIPKKSASYQLAVNTLLKVLSENKINARIKILYFNKDLAQAQTAIDFAQQQKMDLIFAIGSISVDFINKNYRGGQIPVVTSTNKDPVILGQLADYEHGSGTNIAFTSLNVPVNIQMQYLLELKPKLRTIGLMYSLDNEQTIATEVKPAKKAMAEHGIIAIDVPVKSAKTATSDLAQHIPAAIQIMQQHDPKLRESIFWITGSTAIFTHIKLINRFTGHIPVLTSISNVVTEGDDSALLAIGIDRRNNALLASLYAVKILTGIASPGELKLGIVTPPDLAINFRIARKIGLKIPFHFFESATFIYDYEGKAVRAFGQKVTRFNKKNK
jgi:putative ABC transport system substrate-binding protein